VWNRFGGGKAWKHRGNCRNMPAWGRAMIPAGCGPRLFWLSRWISSTSPSIIVEARRRETMERIMSCEGIWVVEMKGPYGWERIAFAFLRNGEYLGAGPNHYSVGTYKEDGDNINISVVVTQHGQLRTIFGEKFAGKLRITSKCKIEKNKIVGISKAKGIKNFDVMLRLTKAGDFD
jgi:hypothetical protein